MATFRKVSKEVKTKNIKQSELNKLSKFVRDQMPKKSADKWDDPDQFVTELIKNIETYFDGKFKVSEFSEKRTRDSFKNKRSDIYIDVDKGSSGLEFEDETGAVGYFQVSHYNDPGTKQDTRYEMNYYIG